MRVVWWNKGRFVGDVVFVLSLPLVCSYIATASLSQSVSQHHKRNEDVHRQALDVWCTHECIHLVAVLRVSVSAAKVA